MFDQHDCDKGSRHGYERVYEPLFEPIRERELRILEVGVHRGASLAAWVEYFPNAVIHGVDTFSRVPAGEVPILGHERVGHIAADSTDLNLLGEFDLIIDDGSHTFEAQRKTFLNLIGNTNWYFIEDHWPLGRMSERQRRHPWLARDGFQREHYVDLWRALDGYDYRVHDLRRGHRPDSCIIEVRR